MALTGTRGLHLYLRTLEAAVEDDIVTDDEMSILTVIARAFALPGGVMGEAWDVLRDQIDNPIAPTKGGRMSGTSTIAEKSPLSGKVYFAARVASGNEIIRQRIVVPSAIPTALKNPARSTGSSKTINMWCRVNPPCWLSNPP